MHYQPDPRHAWDWAYEGYAQHPRGGYGNILVIGAQSPDPYRDLRLGPAMSIPWSPGWVKIIGADAPAKPERQGLAATIAPVVAPATGGITVKKELDSNQILHVEICVDGKCYASSMDLGPAIDAVLHKLAQWHKSQHTDQQVPTTVVVGHVNAMIGAAIDSVVEGLVQHHVSVACGSFIDDIAGAVKGVVSSIPILGPTVVSTLKQFKGPIAAAAGVAAGGAATLIPGVGPFIAPLAGKLANDLVNSAAGDPKAQKAVAQAQQQAATDPNVAAALNAATNSVAQSVAAHHVVNTAKQAAQGHPGAQQEISQISADAQAGDPVSRAATDLIANAFQSVLQQRLGSPTTTSGWHHVIGSAIDDYRHQAQVAAQQMPGRVIGLRLDASRQWQLASFPSTDAADDWFGQMTSEPSAYVYAAYFDKGDPTFPSPLNEALGGAHISPGAGAPIPRGIGEVSG